MHKIWQLAETVNLPHDDAKAPDLKCYLYISNYSILKACSVTRQDSQKDVENQH